MRAVSYTHLDVYKRQGYGILLDISDPQNPRRLDSAGDANFAYWHSATFNNDATSVVFTDE